MSASVSYSEATPVSYLDPAFVRRIVKQRRGVAVFLPTRAQVEEVAAELSWRWESLNVVFYHGGEPIRVIRPFLEGTARKPFVLAMTQAGQSALNVQGLDTVVIYDACYNNVIDRGRNVLTRMHLGDNEILQMAGRVHGRVENGEVHILTDRQLDFETLEPTQPNFQLAGDTERLALTAAALGVDLSELDLPVPIDRVAYANSVENLIDRGLVERGRLTDYGRDVEAMPVDRPWGELLVHASDELIPYVAIASNVDSLHRMTREDSDLEGLVVQGSDHLTAYNVYAEAVQEWGYIGRVYGLPRHLFSDEIDEWSERRGVLVKAIEDVALGYASVMRTLEQALPERVPRAAKDVVREFRELVARVMPFSLVIDEETATGERVRVSRSSVCNRHSAVAGTLSYFADRFGVPRAAIEGTNIPFRAIQRHAKKGGPVVEFRGGNKPGLVTARRTEYFGFELERVRSKLTGVFPGDLADQARVVLARALLDDATPHPRQAAIIKAANRLRDYWRRSGGTLEAAAPDSVVERLRTQLTGITSWSDFMSLDLELDVDDVIPAGVRRDLDSLPASAQILGDRVPIDYGMDAGKAVAILRLREGQARRVRRRDLPDLDRPLRFSVFRGKREVVNAGSLDELHARLQLLTAERRIRGRHTRRRRRRR
jgi:hypothetical protein